MLMRKPNAFILIFVTPIFMIIANYCAVFAHDYAHSITAWLLGYKQFPFDINYGGATWQNILFLINSNENVNYDQITALGQNQHVALIAFAGPGIANGFLYFLTLFLLTRQFIIRMPYLFYFFFWLNLMNLGNFYDYIPIRTFSTKGDLAHILAALNISPWYAYIIGGYLVGFAIWYFFTRTMIWAYVNLQIIAASLRAFIMILCVLTLFGYFGSAGIIGYDYLTYFLSFTSIILIPGVIIACWPLRMWVGRQFHALHSGRWN